jgi:hypothetical protein
MIITRGSVTRDHNFNRLHDFLTARRAGTCKISLPERGSRKTGLAEEFCKEVPHLKLHDNPVDAHQEPFGFTLQEILLDPESFTHKKKDILFLATRESRDQINDIPGIDAWTLEDLETMCRDTKLVLECHHFAYQCPHGEITTASLSTYAKGRYFISGHPSRLIALGPQSPAVALVDLYDARSEKERELLASMDPFVADYLCLGWVWRDFFSRKTSPNSKPVHIINANLDALRSTSTVDEASQVLDSIIRELFLGDGASTTSGESSPRSSADE